LRSALPKWLSVGFAVIGFLGFLDASYLAVKHYLGVPIPCSIFQGCEEVTNSSYAFIGDVPVALLGAIYYAIIFILAVIFIDTGRTAVLSFASRLTIVGFVASLYFSYIQFFVIGAVCVYCLDSAVTSIILFVLGIILFSREQPVAAIDFDTANMIE